MDLEEIFSEPNLVGARLASLNSRKTIFRRQSLRGRIWFPKGKMKKKKKEKKGKINIIFHQTTYH